MIYVLNGKHDTIKFSYVKHAFISTLDGLNGSMNGRSVFRTTSPIVVRFTSGSYLGIVQLNGAAYAVGFIFFYLSTINIVKVHVHTTVRLKR